MILRITELEISGPCHLKLTFNDGVDRDLEHAAVVYLLTAQYLW